MTTVPDGFHTRSASTSTMVPTGLGTGMHGFEPRLQDAPIVSMRKMLCARRPWRVLGTDGKPRAPSVLRATSWLAQTVCKHRQRVLQAAGVAGRAIALMSFAIKIAPTLKCWQVRVLPSTGA